MPPIGVVFQALSRLAPHPRPCFQGGRTPFARGLVRLSHDGLNRCGVSPPDLGQDRTGRGFVDPDRRGSGSPRAVENLTAPNRGLEQAAVVPLKRARCSGGVRPLSLH
jgi:hypothetical protein